MKLSYSKLLNIFLLSFLFIPLITIAACPPTPCPSGQICIPNPLCAQSFGELILVIVNIIFNLALIIAPLMIIIAGFYFVTSAGDPKKIIIAKDILRKAMTEKQSSNSSMYQSELQPPDDTKLDKNRGSN